MRLKLSPWLLLVVLAFVWRAIYAYWTPLVNRYVVPPGDDPAYHTERVAELLSGKWSLFDNGYPLGFHLLTSLVATITSWDTLTAVRQVGPALLVLPIPIIYWIGKRLFGSVAGTLAALVWSLLALAPVRAYGDGNYPNLLAGSILVPIALYALYLAAKTQKRRSIILSAVTFVFIAITHHLTFVYASLVAFPLLLWGFFDALAKRELRRNLIVPTLISTATLVALAVLIWISYRPILAPFLSQLLTERSLAQWFGVQSAPVTWEGLLELHNPLVVLFGLLGLAMLLFSKHERSLKILFGGWIGLLLLLSSTPAFGLPERFARELAVPLSLMIGFLVGYLWERTAVWLPRVALLIVAGGIIALDWYASFDRPFALPDPYKPLIRVQHEEELALATLRDATPPGTAILANNSNPYLPFLMQERVIIVPHPDQVSGLIATQPISLLYIGSRPPLTPEDVYPFYAGFDAITEQLLAEPGKELIGSFPTGTAIYRLTVPP